MSQIVPTQNTAAKILPTPSPELRSVMERLMDGPSTLYPGRDPDEAPLRIARPPVCISDAQRAEARDLLPAYIAACQPVAYPPLREWLIALNNNILNPQTEKGFEVRIPGLCLVLEDIPGIVFDRASLKAASSKFDFWPSPKMLLEFFAPRVRELQDQLAALHKAAADPAGTPRTGTTETVTSFADALGWKRNRK